MAREKVKRLEEKYNEIADQLRQLDHRYIAEEFLRSQGLEVPEGSFGLAPQAKQGMGFVTRTRNGKKRKEKEWCMQVYGFTLNGERYKLKSGTSWPEALSRWGGTR